MQIQFLLYHYFNAKEYYNIIRCYIAAYVWLTGFGNFSFYYCKKDFSLHRFCAMQWRLNFFVVWCCLLLHDEYMLYYICMLHTTFTVWIYAGLGTWPDLNHHHYGVRAKFLILAALAILVWDVPGVFPVLWSPLRFLVDYKGSLQEWAFRSGLDHLVWIAGMLTAFVHPNADGVLERLDAMAPVSQYAIKAGVVAACVAALAVWGTSVLSLPKKEYNHLHPFTSFIPITVYLVLRNISSHLRCYHMALFAWMGKITLETYICQFHIWMVTAGPNENPKQLLQLLPPQYPLLNFALVSAIFVFVSNRVFHVTNALKAVAIPAGKDGPTRLRSHLIALPLLTVAVYLLGSLLTLSA
eukprot:TRINITY_DN12542_c0_g1_i1.p1 TRINITY_DN12542_c0_g1~~TRINITY_DN12542_c0_g1_i1.p1  ORF type:complete len:354 (+),score=139.09 TRINITY_DN12542_c0_g1_i1:690-1751(+)